MGQFARRARGQRDYRRGYLCGMVRGDGHLGSYHVRARRAERTATSIGSGSRSQTDEALRPDAASTLAARGAATDRVRVPVGPRRTGSRQAIDGHPDVRARQGDSASATLIEWPRTPHRRGWRKGFLAGDLRCGGQSANGVVRIANTDPEMIGWTSDCLRRLGFDVGRRGHTDRNALRYVRVRGGAPRADAVHAQRSIPRSAGSAAIDGTAHRRRDAAARRGGDRAARPATARCTTSPPAPGTSSPTAS